MGAGKTTLKNAFLFWESTNIGPTYNEAYSGR